MSASPKEPLILDAISSEAKAAIARAKECAFREGLLPSISIIDNEMHGKGPPEPLGMLALWMTRAELLYLDFQAKAARSIFETNLIPLVDELPPTLGYTVLRNALEVDLSEHRGELFSAAQEFAKRKNLSTELLNYKDLFYAEEHASEGRHADALSLLEKEAGRTEKQACWPARRLAIRRLGVELLRLGRTTEAARCSILAEDLKLGSSVAEGMLRRRDHGAVRDCVIQILSESNLLRHFSVACEVLSGIGDAIPDDLVDSVALWLLPRCSLLPVAGGIGASGPLNMAWKAMEQVGERLPVKVAKLVCDAAVNHEYWNKAPQGNKVFLEREQMIDAVARCIYALPEHDVFELSNKAIRLATEFRQNSDYPNAINLLCHIAERGGEKARSLIGDELFPPGQPVTYLVGQVASVFGKEFLGPERLAKAAKEVAANIMLQVQRLKTGEEPLPVPGSILTFTSPTTQGTLVVSLASWAEVKAMARHRKELSSDAIALLLDALIAVSADPENFLFNREAALELMAEFADIMSQEYASRILDAVIPMARGDIVVSPQFERKESNVFAIGSLAHVRRAAILALARIGKVMPEKISASLEPILERAVTDIDPDVREYAFIAARDVSHIKDSIFTAILLGTRDSDSAAAAAAFAAISGSLTIDLKLSEWLVLLHAARMALQAPAASLRRAVARSLVSLRGRAPEGEVRSAISSLLRESSNDLCYSVREAARVDFP